MAFIYNDTVAQHNAELIGTARADLMRMLEIAHETGDEEDTVAINEITNAITEARIRAEEGE